MVDATELRSTANRLRSTRSSDYDTQRELALLAADVLMREASFSDAAGAEMTRLTNLNVEKDAKISELAASVSSLSQENTQLKTTLAVTQQWLETEKINNRS